jgi:uncharacterized protein with NRDE domain
MCTVVILRRPNHEWPLILGANRDEMADRPWQPPGRHWPDRPDVVAGLDELAGGSWLGVNDVGLVAAIMNREGTLGPIADKRSRGDVVLEALDHAEAADAARALKELDGTAYRPFNLIIADNRDAFWLRALGEGPITVKQVAMGHSMIAARDMNDTSHARIRTYLPRLKAAADPDPGNGGGGDWTGWEALMAASETTPETGPRGAMAFATADGYGTLSSSLIALPAPGVATRPVWRFCAGQPGTAPYQDVTF